ncbi:MAG: hypothetical protein LLF80_07385 [Porphyromonadaceae bacterium]|nr:hypothetical protein [Porphyromonadaceae bacterium]
MKSLYKILILFSILSCFISCTDYYVNSLNPVPVETTYFGVMEVRKTDGNFATAQIPNTGLPNGNYKIIVFPKAMELKSYYVKADAQGKIEVAYKLEKAIEVEPGYEGTVFGVLRIINESGSRAINVPIGFIP